MGSACGCARNTEGGRVGTTIQNTTEKAKKKSVDSSSDSELCCEQSNHQSNRKDRKPAVKLSRLKKAEKKFAESDKMTVRDCIADCYYSYSSDHVDKILSDEARLIHLLNVSELHRREDKSLSFLMMNQSELQKHIRQSWRFWIDKLRAPRFVCAPMVNQSDFHFRLLCRRYGCPLIYTPMVNSRQYMKDTGGRANMFATVQVRSKRLQTIDSSLPSDILSVFSPDTLPDNLLPNDSPMLMKGGFRHLMDAFPSPSVNNIDRPLVVQICGNDPDKMVECARHFESLCDAIDINFGCPQGIARKGNYGAFLLDNVPLMCRLVYALHSSISVPIFAKIRVQPSFEATLRMCELLLLSGASLIAIHGRTRDMKKQLTRDCNFEWIRKINLALPIPVVANGGCHNLEEVEHCLRVTGVAAYMSAESLLTVPSMFLRPMTEEERKKLKCENGELKNEDHWWDVAQRKSVSYEETIECENKCRNSTISNLESITPLSPVRMAKDMIDILHTFDPVKCLPLRADSLSERQIRGHLFKILYRELSILHKERNTLGECRLHTLMNQVWPGIVEKKAMIGPKKWDDLYSMTSSWYFRWFHTQTDSVTLASICEVRKRHLRGFFKQLKKRQWNLIAQSESEQFEVDSLLKQSVNDMNEEMKLIEKMKRIRMNRAIGGQESSTDDDNGDDDDSLLEKEGQFVSDLFGSEHDSDDGDYD